MDVISNTQGAHTHSYYGPGQLTELTGDRQPYRPQSVRRN